MSETETPTDPDLLVRREKYALLYQAITPRAITLLHTYHSIVVDGQKWYGFVAVNQEQQHHKLLDHWKLTCREAEPTTQKTRNPKNPSIKTLP